MAIQKASVKEVFKKIWPLTRTSRTSCEATAPTNSTLPCKKCFSRICSKSTRFGPSPAITNRTCGNFLQILGIMATSKSIPFRYTNRLATTIVTNKYRDDSFAHKFVTVIGIDFGVVWDKLLGNYSIGNGIHFLWVKWSPQNRILLTTNILDKLKPSSLLAHLVCETQMTLQTKDSVPFKSLFVRILLTSENPNSEWSVKTVDNPIAVAWKIASWARLEKAYHNHKST